MALQFRGRFGNMGAADMSKQVSGAALQLGLSTEGTQQAIGRLGFAGQGGTQQARENLEKIMSAGLAKGIEDSGLLERVTDLVTAYQESQGAQTDSGRIAQQMLSGIGPDVNARTIEAAASAQQSMGNMMQQGGIRGFVKQRLIMDFFRKQGITDPDKIFAAGRMSMEDLQSEGGQKLLGLDESQRSAFQRDMVDQFYKEVGTTTSSGANKINALKKKKAAGQTVTEEDINSLGATLFAQGDAADDSSARALARQILTKQGVLDPVGAAGLDAFKAQQEAAARGGTAEAKAESLRFKGMGATETDIQGLRTNMDAYVQEFGRQMEATKSFGEQVDLTTDGVKRLSDALNALAGQIEQMTGRPSGSRSMLGSGRSSATTPASNQ
jgi:hypothetical protein